MKIKFVNSSETIAAYSDSSKTIYMNSLLKNKKYKNIRDYLLKHEREHAKIKDKNIIRLAVLQAGVDWKEVLTRDQEMFERLYEFSRDIKDNDSKTLNLVYNILIMPLSIINISRLIIHYFKKVI